MTDGGAQLTSSEFRKFLVEWGIKHATSSPGHHSANGKAESAVKIAKYILMKAARDGADPNLALLELRNTPRQDTRSSRLYCQFKRPLHSVENILLFGGYTEWRGRLNATIQPTTVRSL